MLGTAESRFLLEATIPVMQRPPPGIRRNFTVHFHKPCRTPAFREAIAFLSVLVTRSFLCWYVVSNDHAEISLEAHSLSSPAIAESFDSLVSINVSLSVSTPKLQGPQPTRSCSPGGAALDGFSM